MSARMQMIIDNVHELLEGTNLQFAVVLWIDGKPAYPDGISVSSPVKNIAEAEPYLRLAADQIKTPQADNA